MWRLAKEYGREPDLVVSSGAWTQSAEGQDQWWQPVVPTGLTEDRWVTGIEVRPSLPGRRIVHHAVVYLQQEKQPGDHNSPVQVLSRGSYFTEFAVGKIGDVFRENTGKLLKVGSQFSFDIHCHSVGGGDHGFKRRKSDPPDGPFVGFRVRRVILAGCSKQGLIIRLYMRDSHGLYRMADGHSVFDGYFPACVADWPTSLSGLVVENFTPAPIDVPVINLATQQEPESWPDSGRLYRRPDSDEPDDRFRLYEVAGMPHGVARRLTPGATTCEGQRTSRFPSEHVTNNALDKLIRWVDQGIVPPRADRLATVGPAGSIEVDENGNAVGGVRTTYLDVPIAAYRTCMLSGYEVPFSPQRLAELYQSSGDYVKHVNRRLDELIREGWYLEEDAQEIRTEAVQIALDWGRDGAF